VSSAKGVKLGHEVVALSRVVHVRDEVSRTVEEHGMNSAVLVGGLFEGGRHAGPQVAQAKSGDVIGAQPRRRLGWYLSADALEAHQTR